MTKKIFIFRMLIAITLLITLAYTWNLHFMYDKKDSFGYDFGSIHIVFNLLLTIAMGWIGIHALYNSLTDGNWSFISEKEAKQLREKAIENGEDTLLFDFNFSISILKIGLFAFFIVFIYHIFGFVKDSKKMYNKSIIYQNDYIQTVQEKQGFYENLWNSWAEQKMITSLSKDTFIEVSKIIMENRKDGEKVAWKWLQETKQISFSEFSDFYSKLSEFIRSERQSYFKIEMRCQDIANKNNTLLDTFPNNMYNKVIGCKRINFEYGFAGEKKTNIFTLKSK